MPGIKKQKKLQLAAGLLMLLAVIGVERLAVRPVGIYMVAGEDARPFAAGMDRERVMKRVNGIKSIREIMTCSPESRITLTSRKGFAMTEEMALSRAWTLKDRQKGVYWLGFEGSGRLGRVLFLNEPDREGQAPLLSLVCDPGLFHAPAHWIASRTGFEVFSR